MKKLLLVTIALLFTTQPVFAGHRIDNQSNSPTCPAHAVANGIEAQMIAQGVAVPEGGFDKKWISDQLGSLYPEDVLDLACSGLMGDDGNMYSISGYQLIDSTADSIREALTGGAIVVINTKCKMEDWKDGEITNTDTLETTTLHAVYLYGYDDEWFYGVNSWGTKWGDEGTFKMSREYAQFPNILGAFIVTL